MTQTFILTPKQLEAFDRRGVLRLVGLLPAEAVRRAREAVLRPLARLGLWRDGAWRLGDAPKPRFPDPGLTTKAIGADHADLEALLGEPALLATVVALLEGRAIDWTLHKRPQILFTLPNAEVWTTPAGWHVDTPRLASGRRPGVQMFAFLGPVEPRGGGTLVVAGSHRLLNAGRFIKAKEIRGRLGREAFFRDLYSKAPVGADAHARLMGRAGAAGDVALEIVELTGAPGDVYFTDLRLIHAAAPNAAARPRMMATHRFVCAEVVQELAEGYGWK